MIGLVVSALGLVVSLAGLVFAVNGVLSAMRAHEDRIDLITRASLRMRTGHELLNAMRTVPYKTHMWRRFFWRDPWNLYPPVVTEAMNKDAFPEPPEIKLEIGGILVPVDEEKGPTLQ